MTGLKAQEEICNLEEEEVAIIEEIAEVLARRQKDKLSALRDVPKKKLAEEIAKVDKILCKFIAHNITKTNELFYVGAVNVTNRLEVKIKKASEKREPMLRRLENKVKELRKDLKFTSATKLFFCNKVALDV